MDASVGNELLQRPDLAVNLKELTFGNYDGKEKEHREVAKVLITARRNLEFSCPSVKLERLRWQDCLIGIMPVDEYLEKMMSILKNNAIGGRGTRR